MAARVFVLFWSVDNFNQGPLQGFGPFCLGLNLIYSQRVHYWPEQSWLFGKNLLQAVSGCYLQNKKKKTPSCHWYAPFPNLFSLLMLLSQKNNKTTVLVIFCFTVASGRTRTVRFGQPTKALGVSIAYEIIPLVAIQIQVREDSRSNPPKTVSLTS